MIVEALAWGLLGWSIITTVVVVAILWRGP